MTPRVFRVLAIGAMFVALMACAAPDRRAGISLDLQGAQGGTPRHFNAEIDLGPISLSLSLRWRAGG